MERMGSIMFEGLFTNTYYGNSIEQWFTALGIMVVGFIVSRIVYWIFKNVVRKLVEKTKTKFDDIIIDMAEEPVSFGITILAIWLGLRTLTFPDTVYNVINRGYFFLIIFVGTWLVARLIDALIQEYAVPLVDKSEGDLDDQLLPIARKGIKISVWTVGTVVAVNNAGYDVGAIVAGLGIGGLAFALAAKDTLTNLFGGFTIFADRPFKVNDRVKIDGFDGSIKEIGLRSTRLQTLEGRTVSIPNSKFTENSIENISSEPSRKVVLNLGMTYDTDDAGMQKAMETLKEIASANDNILGNHLVGFNGFGDFALNIIFIYYIEAGKSILDTQTAVNMEILKRFNEAGLDFAFPTQSLLVEHKAAA